MAAKLCSIGLSQPISKNRWAAHTKIISRVSNELGKDLWRDIPSLPRCFDLFTKYLVTRSMLIIALTPSILWSDQHCMSRF